MKGLFEYVQEINEGRGRPAKVNKDNDGTYYSGEMARPGADAKSNGTGGRWEVGVKRADDDIIDDFDEEEMGRNTLRLYDKFNSEEDFFIQGEAGWGKTSIIIDLAKRFHRNILTVYLDKAVASDLGGIPVPIQGKSGAAQEMAIPAWAKYIEDHEDEDFLLFFDEMNQATPDVMNALMPIVLNHQIRMDGKTNVINWQTTGSGNDIEIAKKHKDILSNEFGNFFVGAAGNLAEENEGGITELSGPLESRFKPIITWESGTKEAWNEAWKHIRHKWQNDISKDLLDIIGQNLEIFKNPRELEHKVLKHALKTKRSGRGKFFNADFYRKERLENLVKPDLSRSQEAALDDIAEAIDAFVMGTDGPKAKGEFRRDMLNPELVQLIKQGIEKGYLIDDDGNRAGISEENIRNIELDENEINAEQLEQLIDSLIEDGIKFKFKTDKEWKAKGYKDPNAD